MLKTIIINEEDRDYIQKLDIEMSSRQNLISFMISSNMNIETEQFKRYQAEYNEYFIQFEKSKRDIIEKKYLNSIDESLQNLAWNLDYASCELTYDDGK